MTSSVILASRLRFQRDQSIVSSAANSSAFFLNKKHGIGQAGVARAIALPQDGQGPGWERCRVLVGDQES